MGISEGDSVTQQPRRDEYQTYLMVGLDNECETGGYEFKINQL